jgi:hypothetical protein
MIRPATRFLQWMWPGLMVLGLLTACSSTSERPTLEEGDFKARSQLQALNGITVTAAVPSAAETKEIFGMGLYRRGIQPVWLEITNNRKQQVVFLPVGLDAQYYSPIEAANIESAIRKSAPPGAEIEKSFYQLGMGNYIDPGQTRSGFIFTALDEGSKAFNVDIISASQFTGFTFFIPVPGLRVDHSTVDWANLYPEEEIRELNRSEIIDVLEQQVCCTTDKKSKGSGDPVNLVVIGGLKDVYHAFLRAGWDETETIHKGSSWKTVKSFLSGGEYRYSPVSGLYVLGRPQDVAFQKARDNIHERNHLRLWVSAYTYEGKPVWLGQISRDIGVRFTTKTITTHKIDPDVDETREYLLEDLAYAQSLQKMAYVEGVGAASMNQPRGNLTGDPYFTDGFRVVLWVTSEPVDISDLQIEHWKTPPDRQ